MWIKNKKINLLEKAINKLNNMLQEGNYVELTYLLGNKKEIMIRNLIAGIFRGIGIGIGVTVITAILVYLLQKIVTLNIPIIGEYIADIVDIVERSRWEKRGQSPFLSFLSKLDEIVWLIVFVNI